MCYNVLYFKISLDNSYKTPYYINIGIIVNLDSYPKQESYENRIDETAPAGCFLY